MKLRGYIEFIIILILILLLYFAFITNIDQMTMSYQGKLGEYKNIYYKDLQEVDILQRLREIGEYHKTVPDEVIRTIQNSKIITNIIKKFGEVEEKDIGAYITKMQQAGRLNFAAENIIYIIEEQYELAFTLDMENIIYQKTRNDIGKIEWNSREITIENKYEIYKKVEKEIIQLGITEKFQFEPETIYFSYAIEGDLDSDGYAIEDNKNQIKLVVRRPNYEIEKLQIGFAEDFEI